MADNDDEDDLYDEEFDFVDDDEDDEEEGYEEEAESDDVEAEEAPKPTPRSRRPRAPVASSENEPESADSEGEPVDEYGRPEPAANYLVHIYENRKFKRTIDRPFTPEDAESFASEYNRTNKNYSRFALTGKNDAKPKKALD